MAKTYASIAPGLPPRALARVGDQVLVVRPCVVPAGAPPVSRRPPVLRHHDVDAARPVHRVEEVGVCESVRRVGHRRRARLEQPV
jgi:hypothetical protein